MGLSKFSVFIKSSMYLDGLTRSAGVLRPYPINLKAYIVTTQSRLITFYGFISSTRGFFFTA